VPKDSDTVLVEVDEKNKMFKWFHLSAEEIGQLQYVNVRRWVSDDGLEFASPEAGREYFTRRKREAPRPLPPGTYSVRVEAVLQQGPRLVLRLRDGGEIVINTDG
jgi:hypothetical protein